ncbi:hypothetical protein B9J09_01590 [Xylella fastidiosa subsp. pauca]|uniref:Uncharacterized protein n=1 Tax=Xylella fastidiosa (strain 9a5c) TaxID=160492 RepID=Q9PGE0_XYLFA|nr:hypothetical protein XF_0362 [Xylella fastidiosa 9a5c]ARO67931.1 hypothetical protein B9J09_01590 [Xylella fastidiosa subsp. pauca]
MSTVIDVRRITHLTHHPTARGNPISLSNTPTARILISRQSFSRNAVPCTVTPGKRSNQSSHAHSAWKQRRKEPNQNKKTATKNRTPMTPNTMQQQRLAPIAAVHIRS